MSQFKNFNDSKQNIVLTTNLLELLTFKKCLKGFFTSISNITTALQNWRNCLCLNKGFDSKALLTYVVNEI